MTGALFPEQLTGFRRADGRVGIRNRVVVLAAADNVNPLAAQIAAESGATLVPATFGRGQLGADLEVTLRTQAAIAAHPNVIHALIVSFERESAERIAVRVREQGRQAKCLSLLETSGHTETLRRGVEHVQQMRLQADGMDREPIAVTDLVIGLECGGSDATSGLVSNPTVGRFSDRLLAEGATAVFSEPVELIGCEAMLDARAVTPDVAIGIRRLTAHYARVADSAGVNLVGINPTADNIAGGLTSIEEKSLGAVAKCGSAPIQGIVEYGQAAPGAGLWLMDAPAAAVENLTALGAGGCHLILFTSGSVNPSGNPVAPTLKICANPHAVESMGEHVDVDLSDVLTGAATSQQALERVTQAVVDVVGGEETAADRLGYVETRISRVGLSV